MSTIQEFEKIEEGGRITEGERGSGSRRTLTSRERNSGVDLVLPVTGSTDAGAAVEHAIKLAKTYGARIVLLYFTRQDFIPSAYLDYARAERVRDLGSMYYDSLSESTVATLRGRIEEEGIECASHVCIGSLADAIRTCQQNVRVLMLVLPVAKKTLRDRFSRSGFRLEMMTKLNVPVLLVPA